VRLPGACFAAFFRRAEAAGPGRVGLSVSRRVGGAVVRNRVRRRLRELIRRHWDELPHGCEVVFHVYPAIVGATAAELETQVRRAFRDSSRALRSGRDSRSGPSRRGA
jgi:ribonuclease P protein component